MSRYVYFTDEQKEQARRTDIVSLLKSQGEKLKKSGTEYQWNDGSEKITIRGNLWYDQYERVGGDAIEFVKRFYNKDFIEAMEFLLGECSGTLVTSAPIEKQVKPFELPLANENMRRVYAYLLNRRGIDLEVINTFVYKRMIYESKDYHNVVFVGFDKNGKACHAHKRGTAMKSRFKGNIDSSLPQYSFHWHGTSTKLFIFEAPIDMLSFISMHKEKWKEHSYAASCGVSDYVIYQMIMDNPNIKKVYLCLDNDKYGKKAVKRISAELSEKGIENEALFPSLKDWNEDLTSEKEMEGNECLAQGM